MYDNVYLTYILYIMLIWFYLLISMFKYHTVEFKLYIKKNSALVREGVLEPNS